MASPREPVPETASEQAVSPSECVADGSGKALPRSSQTSPVSPPSHTPPLPAATAPRTAASTYTDIINTLKLLEEAPPPLSGSKSGETPPTKKNSKSNDNPMMTCHDVGVARGVAKESTSLSESKLQSILDYLDDVERADGELSSQLSSQSRGRQGREGGSGLTTDASGHVTKGGK